MGRLPSSTLRPTIWRATCFAGVHAGDDLLAEVAPLGDADGPVELAGLGGEDRVVEVDSEQRPARLDRGRR